MRDCQTLAGMAVWALLISTASCSKSATEREPGIAAEHPEQNDPAAWVQGMPAIEGTRPSEFARSMKEAGFPISGPHQSESGVEWRGNNEGYQCSFVVVMTCGVDGAPRSVSADVLNSGLPEDLTDDVSALRLMTVTRSLGLPETAEEWVRKNINKSGSETFHNTKVELIANAPRARSLRISSTK